MTTLKTDAPVYTDLAGLSALKRGAANNDPAAIREVAQQFESMFTGMMLKSMREAQGTDPMFGSDQEKMYQGMSDDQLAIQMSKGKGLGLADMLIRQLQKMGVSRAQNRLRGTSASGAAQTGSARRAASGRGVQGAAPPPDIATQANLRLGGSAELRPYDVAPGTAGRPAARRRPAQSDCPGGSGDELGAHIPCLARAITCSG